ncbi:alkyl sulfatase dimerization domain-containing protein [Kordiimonas sediminis]|nr:alkyl sulfatase dimerization domain-containing protein [Kordiimonas sediminis]
MSRHALCRGLSALSITSMVMLAACSEQPMEPDFSDEFSIPPYLLEHWKLSEEKVTKVSGAPVWQFANVNGGIPNVSIIEGETGLIVVDTNISIEDGRRALELIREQTSKPVLAVIYTHHHIDHVGGASNFVSIEDAANGSVPVIAGKSFLREMQDENGVTAQIMGIRALYMYGNLLDPETDGRDFQVGIGGKVRPGKNGYVEPNTFVDGKLEMTIDGIDVILFETGGEAASHIAVYLPKYRAILSGDEIQGPTFPNLHSLRGTKPRDAEKWVTAIDRMRDYSPEYLIPSHGPVVEGATEIETILRTYRDAIQWTHDQSVRLMNAGYTGEEIANILTEVPEHLSITPWTREVYGTVRHSVRSYFTHYISWWDGDPTTLAPTPPPLKAERTIALMGGRTKVQSEAQKVLEAGDPQWAAELATLLIVTDNTDQSAKNIKARALRQLGYKTLNTNWRGFYLTGARELEGLIDSEAIQARFRKNLSTEAIATDRLLSLMRYRLVPEKAELKHIKVGFRFPDTNEAYTLELRNQILIIHPGVEDDVDSSLTLDRALYDRMVRQEISLAEELLSGSITITGSKLAVLDFFSSFDLEIHPINLVVR